MTFLLRYAAPPCKSLGGSCFPARANSPFTHRIVPRIATGVARRALVRRVEDIDCSVPFPSASPLMTHAAPRNASTTPWVTGQAPGARGVICCVWSWGQPLLKGGMGFESGLESACCWISVKGVNGSSLPLPPLYLGTCARIVLKAHRQKSWHVKAEWPSWIWERGGTGQEGMTSWAPFGSVRKARVASDAFQYRSTVFHSHSCRLFNISHASEARQKGGEKEQTTHMRLYIEEQSCVGMGRV